MVEIKNQQNMRTMSSHRESDSDVVDFQIA